MEIKTIWNTVDDSWRFDADVNAAISDGWRLVKREVLPGMSYTADTYARRLLYAELVKEEEAPPVSWEDAVQVIKGMCACQPDTPEGCMGCKMGDLCTDNWRNAPEDWCIHEEVPDEE